MPTQAIDVRDLAAWLLDLAQQGTTGTFDAVGPVVPFDDWVALAAAAAGYTGPVAVADPQWLLDQGVGAFMGPESMAMWMPDPKWAASAPAAEPRPTRPDCATAHAQTCWRTFCGGNAPRGWTAPAGPV